MSDLKPRNQAIIIINRFKRDLVIGSNSVESLKQLAKQLAINHQQGRIDVLAEYVITSGYENEVLIELKKL